VPDDVRAWLTGNRGPAGLETEASLAVGVTNPQSGVGLLPPRLQCWGNGVSRGSVVRRAIDGKEERLSQNITAHGRPGGHPL